MRENRTSGSMRGHRKRATAQRACALLYACPLAEFEAAPHARLQRAVRRRGIPLSPADSHFARTAFCPIVFHARSIATLPSAL
jgi:hypothetical protein